MKPLDSKIEEIVEHDLMCEVRRHPKNICGCMLKERVEQLKLLLIETVKEIVGEDEESEMMKSATATEIINHDRYVRNALRKGILEKLSHL